MQPRKDGEQTRRAIMQAAAAVFGAKGYRDATNKDICDKAGANIAAVNYHFGSKADLYRAIMQAAVDKAQELYPLDAGLPPGTPCEKRLEGAIGALLNRFSDDKHLEHLHKIRMTEHVSPTGLINDIMTGMVKRTRGYMNMIIREMLGPAATDEDVALCEMSVMSQCLMRPGRHARVPGFVKKKYPGLLENVDLFREHITRFSLAGIRAVKKQIDTRTRR